LQELSSLSPAALDLAPKGAATDWVQASNRELEACVSEIETMYNASVQVGLSLLHERVRRDRAG
jgi:hypothetical protein